MTKQLVQERFYREKTIISMHNNINLISTKAATILRVCNTYFVKISINVIPNNRSDSKTSCYKTRLSGTLKK